MKQDYKTIETNAANALLASQRTEDQDWLKKVQEYKEKIDKTEADLAIIREKAAVTGFWDGAQTLASLNETAQRDAQALALTRQDAQEKWQRERADLELKFRGEREEAGEALATQAEQRQMVLNEAAKERAAADAIRSQESYDTFEEAKNRRIQEATGIYKGKPTIAGETFAMSKALQEAEMTGIYRDWEMTEEGPLAEQAWGKGQATMAAKSLVFQQDLQLYREDTTRQLSDNTLKIAQSSDDTRVVIAEKQRAMESGKLKEAIDARKAQTKLEQDKLALDTQRFKLETVMSMANPVTLMIFQRSGLMPVLERLLGIELGFPDFPQMLPEGVSVPTQQYLNYGSPMDRRLMMTESALRTGMSDVDVRSVIQRQMPGGLGVSIGYRGEGR
jgi:hypothetical protein